MWRTILSKPLPALGEEGKQLKEKYDNVLKIVMTVMKDEELINSILEDYPITNDTSMELYDTLHNQRSIWILGTKSKVENMIGCYELNIFAILLCLCNLHKMQLFHQFSCFSQIFKLKISPCNNDFWD
jgi:hypothetical protein